MKALNQLLLNWLTKERKVTGVPMCDFERIKYELRPADVLLFEGRNRISDVIKYITQSSWSHAAIYIGRIHDIHDPIVRNKALEFYDGPPDTQLLVEGMVGRGTIITPLNEYRQDHIRICRPRGLSPQDAQKTIEYSISRLGNDYDIRQILDLMRFMLPWSIFPKRFGSTLFDKTAGKSTRTVCSTMIADAFKAIHFPILPHVQKHEKKGLLFKPRNTRLYTPRDFDYSPYFEIIKYPFVSVDDEPAYRRLPWVSEHGGVNPDYPMD